MDVESILFQPAASAFTIDIGLQVLRIDGAGVINSSGVTQTFMSSGGLEFGKFGGNTSAGDNTLYIIEPHDFNHFFNFYNSSTAGYARFVVSENKSFFNSGWLAFKHFSTAANAEFMINGGAEANKAGGVVSFFDHSSAGSANLTANGGTAPGADGGSITFQDRATLANATLANGGSHGGKAGTIYFDFFARGDRARVELFGSGALQIIYSYARPSLGVGSIEGDGQIFLGGFNLTVGANGLDTTFSGLIGDGSGGRGGSLTKVGNGKLILDHASTYLAGRALRTVFLW